MGIYSEEGCNGDMDCMEHNQCEEFIDVPDSSEVTHGFYLPQVWLLLVRKCRNLLGFEDWQNINLHFSPKSPTPGSLISSTIIERIWPKCVPYFMIFTFSKLYLQVVFSSRVKIQRKSLTYQLQMFST